MAKRLLGTAALCAVVMVAQERPQFVWEGEVDGVSILSVRGNAIDMEDREGLPVQRQRFRFFDSLPNLRQEVEVQVVEGRGRVRVLEQPRPENNYTLRVGIEDRPGGRGFYSLEFFWNAGRGRYRQPDWGTSNNTRGGDSLAWSGRVDDEAIVECRGDVCEARAPHGATVTRDRYRFSQPLPRRDVLVSLEDKQGRGEMLLVQQPREENGHTARVAIRDPQGGAADYSFTLVWVRPARNDGAGDFARRGMVWSGRVDGKVRIVIEGRSAQGEVVTGAPIAGERSSFERDLPARSMPAATVRRLRGRGRVEIVEYPSNRNGFRLVIQIEDTDGGADNYEIEAGW